MTEPLYTRDILRLAASIPHLAGFDAVDGPDVRSPTCGARMRVAVTLDGAGRVASLSQAVEACAFGQAAAALVGNYAIGRTAAEVSTALAATASWLTGAGEAEPWPGFAALASARHRKGRHGAILLPLRALLAAIEAAS
ncbi:MAG: iron-sulfur cluster assembly scaffold protein [Sphingomicrobium sp.]